MGARLTETAAHLCLVLWDTALVDAAVGGAAGPDAAVIDAAVGRLRRTLRRFISLPRMLLLCWLPVLLLALVLLFWLLRVRLQLLCGPGLLLRLSLVFVLLLMLCVSGNSTSKDAEQSCGGDNSYVFHFCCLSYGLNLERVTYCVVWTNSGEERFAAD